jgi:hypothetical protein
MTLYDDTRAHPLPGFIDNREWEATRARRADLYLEERARRNAPVKEFRRPSFLIIICAGVLVAVALVGAMV